MHARLFFTTLFIVTLAPGLAAAEDGPAPIVIVDQSELPTAGAETEHATERWHQGFYLRAGLGIGYFADDFSGDGAGWVDSTAHGGSGAFELMVGGSLMDGFVLGGGILVEQVVDPVVEVENIRVDSDVAVGTFGMIGPFLDWYPSPDGGFHVQAMIGAARIDIEDESGVKSDHAPVGGGISLGAGYEWWIADEWSVGFLGRLTGATLGDDGVTHRVGSASLLATVTYN